MSVRGNLTLSGFTGITSSVSPLGLRFGQLSSSLLKKQFITYLTVELKEKNLALVATRAFPRNCFQAPGQKGASPNIDVAWCYFIAWASQATWWHSALEEAALKICLLLAFKTYI